jgi:hypothetical protein
VGDQDAFVTRWTASAPASSIFLHDAVTFACDLPTTDSEPGRARRSLAGGERLRSIRTRLRTRPWTERLRRTGLVSLLLAAIASIGCGQEWWDEPTPYYGPPQCTSDEACVAEHGANWYCDRDNRINHDVRWPLCKSR